MYETGYFDFAKGEETSYSVRASRVLDGRDHVLKSVPTQRLSDGVGERILGAFALSFGDANVDFGVELH